MTSPLVGKSPSLAEQRNGFEQLGIGEHITTRVGCSALQLHHAWGAVAQHRCSLAGARVQ